MPYLQKKIRELSAEYGHPVPVMLADESIAAGTHATFVGIASLTKIPMDRNEIQNDNYAKNGIEDEE